MTKLAQYLLLSTAAVGSVFAFPAFAADIASDSVSSDEQAAVSDRSGSDEIVVTARRREERLQDVPISITVFGQDQLTNRNVSNPADIATYTPSLGANNLFGSENTTFSLRGFSQDIGTAPSVGVYFADVVALRGGNLAINVGDGAGAGNLFDLENMQVLKGPQGTLFGRNTTGGAILLVPAKPTDRFEGYVEGSIGNYDMRRVQAVVNAPVSDNLRVRLGVDRQLRDGYLINDSAVGPRAFNDSNYFAARLSVVADITPNLENYFIASYSHSNSIGSLQKIIACNDTPVAENFLGLQACGLLASQNKNGFWHTNNQVPNPKSDLEQWQLINTTTWNVSDNVTLKNIVSYGQLKYDIASNLYGTDFYIAPELPFYFVSLFSMPNGHAAYQSTFSEEFQLQGSWLDGRLDWQTGVYLEMSDPVDGMTGTQTPVYNSCSDPDNFECVDLTGYGIINYTAGAIKYRNLGLYTQATYKLTDQLNLTGGFRYTWDKTSGVSRQITYAYAMQDDPIAFCTDSLKASLPDCDTKLLQKSSAPTWTLGLDYSPTRDLMLYGKWSRGYRTGGVKPDNPAPYDRFDQEKVDTYEIGAKTGFRGAVSGNFNIAAFYNNFTNQQMLIQFNDNPADNIQVSPSSGPVNAGKSAIYGIEVEANLQFSGFRLDGSYAYLHTEIKEIDEVGLPDTSPYVTAGTMIAGDRLTFAPDHKWSLTGSYAIPMNEADGQISLSATWTHIGKQRYNYTGRLPEVLAFTGGVDINVQEPVDMLNLNINWKNVAGGPVDLSLFMTNVTNEKYYNFTGPIFPAAGFETGSVSEPRMFGARLRVNFGG